MRSRRSHGVRKEKEQKAKQKEEAREERRGGVRRECALASSVAFLLPLRFVLCVGLCAMWLRGESTCLPLCWGARAHCRRSLHPTHPLPLPTTPLPSLLQTTARVSERNTLHSTPLTRWLVHSTRCCIPRALSRVAPLARRSLPRSPLMSHRHSASCGCAEDAKQSDALSSSLYPAIDRARIWCLNESAPDSGQACIRPWDERQSDARLLSDPDDGELLLFIPFTAAVHVRSIAVMAWGDWQPKKIKL